MNAVAPPLARTTWSGRAALAAGRMLPARTMAHQAGGGECLLPYYHVVSDDWLPHISPLYPFRSVRDFREDLDYLLRFFQPLSLGEFLSSPSGAARTRDTMLLTFDDGFREIHDVIAPILKAKGVPAVFFLTSATVDNRLLCAHQQVALLLNQLDEGISPATQAEIIRRLPGHPTDLIAGVRALGYRDGATLGEIAQIIGVDFSAFLATRQPYLTQAQARALLADGFEIGAHSIDHPLYSQLSLADQLRQTLESMEVLQEKLGLRHRVFAFPHADSGVSATFFRQLSRLAKPEATFGTSAPRRETTAAHYQRFSMEKYGWPAPTVLAWQAFRRAKHLVANSRPLQRDGLS